MVKVLLLNPPVRHLPGEARHASPPLGLAYIGASLEAQQIPVRIIDAVTLGYDVKHDYAPDVTGIGATPEMISDAVRDFAPDLIGISCLFTMSSCIAYSFAQHFRQLCPQAKIVFGGTHATVMARDLVREAFCDFVVRGEGERAMIQLAESLDGRRAMSDVNGLTWLNSDQEVVDNPQLFIEDIDSLPRPARHLLDMESYIKIGRMQGGAYSQKARATTLITSRGCPAKCVFCAIHSVWGRKFRGHSPEYVLAELEDLKKTYGITHLLFEDDNLTYDPVRSTHIFQGMIEARMDFTWDTPNGVALWRLDEPLIRLMKAAGCNRLFIAIESGVQDTLFKLVRKPLRLDQAEALIAVCRSLRLPTTAFFVIGFPGETVAAITESLAYAERLPTNTVAIMIATPYPGTPLYDQCVKMGYLVKDFDVNRLYTRVGQISTPDFTPELLFRLITRTQVRRAWRFPLSTGGRLFRKCVEDPRALITFLGRRFLTPLRKPRS